MIGGPYFIFCLIFVVVIMLEYDFLTKDHIRCDVSPEKKEYVELFCMARTRNLRTNAYEAHLTNYGRWQFYIIAQMLITVISCKLDLKIWELKRRSVCTVGKRYILTVCILLNIIVCWMFTQWSMGGHFNHFISRVLSHSIDRKAVVSPLDDAFPMEAECLIEPDNHIEIYTATCELPLHSTAPLYFIVLFGVYLLGFLWTADRLLSLAKEKIFETKKSPEVTETSQRIFTTHLWENQATERRVTWEKKLTEMVKQILNRPHMEKKARSVEPLI